jgi:uncharacterized membrane protein HdeD (DUF308 family)
LRRKFSGLLGVAGGLVDFIVGLSILAQNSMNGIMMLPYLLLVLGALVLLTGVYLLASKMMAHGSTIGLLMLLYGVIMLALGVGMIGQLFNLMMIQSSIVSGSLMILLGAAMLYSGFDMTKGMRTSIT